jgi:hypothetical protein
MSYTHLKGEVIPSPKGLQSSYQPSMVSHGLPLHQKRCF